MYACIYIYILYRDFKNWEPKNYRKRNIDREDRLYGELMLPCVSLQSSRFRSILFSILKRIVSILSAVKRSQDDAITILIFDEGQRDRREKSVQASPSLSQHKNTTASPVEYFSTQYKSALYAWDTPQLNIAMTFIGLYANPAHSCLIIRCCLLRRMFPLKRTRAYAFVYSHASVGHAYRCKRDVTVGQGRRSRGREKKNLPAVRVADTDRHTIDALNNWLSNIVE